MATLKIDGLPATSDDWSDDDFDKWFDFLSAIEDSHSIKIATWSVTDVRDFTKVPYPHARWVTYEGYSSDDDMRFLPIDATWLDIWKVIDRLVLCGTDHHHRFIEAVWCSEEGEISFMLGS